METADKVTDTFEQSGDYDYVEKLNNTVVAYNKVIDELLFSQTFKGVVYSSLKLAMDARVEDALKTRIVSGGEIRVQYNANEKKLYISKVV